MIYNLLLFRKVILKVYILSMKVIVSNLATLVSSIPEFQALGLYIAAPQEFLFHIKMLDLLF